MNAPGSALGLHLATPCRGVAQPGRAPGSGPGGRRFKSSLPDQLFPNTYGADRSLKTDAPWLFPRWSSLYNPHKPSHKWPFARCKTVYKIDYSAVAENPGALAVYFISIES